MRLTIIFLTTMLLIITPLAVSAGQLTPPGPPGSKDSAMFTIEDLYNCLRYAECPADPQSGFFGQPLNGPTVDSGHTLDDLMGAAPLAANSNTGVLPQHVKAGKVFLGAMQDGWLQRQTGTLQKQTGVGLSEASTAVAEGYYDTTRLDAVDPDLKSANIHRGITIFGIVGDPNVVNTAAGDATAADIQQGRTAWVKAQAITGTAEISSRVRKTGQATSYAAGDDGDLEKGKGAAATGFRFSDNGDGTVTDDLTGLIWLKKANCVGKKMWNEAIEAVNALGDGACGLTDGSAPGDWRLPNVKEIHSLLNFDCSSSGFVLSGDVPFVGFWNTFYWTSTTSPAGADQGWEVSLANGQTGVSVKSTKNYVWAVRGGL